jgi:hypothetical protein
MYGGVSSWKCTTMGEKVYKQIKSQAQIDKDKYKFSVRILRKW